MASDHFVVEVARPRIGHQDVTALADKARAATSATDRPVRFVRAIAVPEDGWCLLLFAAASRVDVETVARDAGIGFAQITQPIVAGPPATSTGEPT